MVGVEVGDGEVREGLPPEPLACQAVEGAGPTIQHEPHVPLLEPVRGGPMEIVGKQGAASLAR